jgi:hypothetical protein
MMKWHVNILYTDVNWTKLAQDYVQWLVLELAVLNILGTVAIE